MLSVVDEGFSNSYGETSLSALPIPAFPAILSITFPTAWFILSNKGFSLFALTFSTNSSSTLSVYFFGCGACPAPKIFANLPLGSCNIGPYLFLATELNIKLLVPLAVLSIISLYVVGPSSSPHEPNAPLGIGLVGIVNPAVSKAKSKILPMVDGLAVIS